MPPPIPWFSGRSVSASEVDGLLAIRPLRGHGFVAPRGTGVLYVPIATLARATVQRLADPAWSTITFIGEFTRVDQPSPLMLEAVRSDDADELVRRLHARHELPRIARWVPAEILRHSREPAYVVTAAEYRPGHFETADFAGMRLAVPEALRDALRRGERYRATGFFAPGASADGDPQVVGYGGPRLTALALAPADAPTIPARDPASDHPRPRLQIVGNSRSTAQWHEEAAAVFELGGAAARLCDGHAHPGPFVCTWPRGALLLVVDGIGGQGVGVDACQAVLTGLATCCGDTSAPIDRATWLGAALGRVSRHLQAQTAGQGFAVLAAALVLADELHVAHLGDARVLRLRAGALTALTRDHGPDDDPALAAPTPELAALLPDNILVRALGAPARDEPTVTRHDLQDGDTLVLATRGLHRRLTAARITAALRGASPEAAVAELLAVSEGVGDDITLIVAHALPA